MSMETWEDQAIVLKLRPHGENGGIVSLLTPQLGRHPGYVRGVHSKRMRGTLEVGSVVEARWQARTNDQLGSVEIELVKSTAAPFLNQPLKLGALQSACALCDASLPEREKHEGLYNGLLSLFDALGSDVWGAAYVIWEIALLRELGFSLDLSRCAAGGDSSALAYVSPRTGCAVSYEAGQPYKEKLLPLPAFLKPNRGPCDDEDVYDGLQMTGYFLQNWVFAQANGGVPQDRLRFAERFAKTLEPTQDEAIERKNAAG